MTIYVWGLGRIGITVIMQCVEKERTCNISIDANSTQPIASTQIIERAIRELLEKRFEIN